MGQTLPIICLGTLGLFNQAINVLFKIIVKMPI